MAIKFLGYWEDKTSISERMKSPKEYAIFLEKVHSEHSEYLQDEMPKESLKKFFKSLVEPYGYVVVEDDQQAG